jgi:hypothetical protein
MEFQTTSQNKHTAEVDVTLYEFALGAGSTGGNALTVVT